MPKFTPKQLWITATLFGGCALVACVVPIPTQGWRPDRGPVVPHDSFPADCALCHQTGDWNTIKQDFAFDHDAETGWPLTGAHGAAECLLCHNDRGPAGVFAQRSCSGCHEDPHQGHLGVQCDACHGEQDWRPREAIAEHASTRFPLTGAHALTACFACHSGATAGNFQRADTHCASCHAQDAAVVTAPDHGKLGWTDCEDCHKATSFSDVRFDHPSSFPLTAAHAAVSCEECHGTGSFAALPTGCESCHMSEYQATTAPAHVAAGFPTDCASCHRATNWRRARFDHSTFTLKGAHKRTDCADCHTGGNYAGTPRDCIACHDADYRAATNPDHVAGGFSTDCTACHGNATFRGATFDHSTYALTGRHKAADCSQCHTGDVFAGTPRDCVGCHRADYDATRDPDHRTAGFPTACDSCHLSTTTWDGARFNHSFPIDSGPHRRLDCADCHTTTTTTQFSCTHCHEHRKTEADKEHREVRDYTWSSAACYQCHPTGREK